MELGNTLYERAKQERGPERRAAREALLREAIVYLEQALVHDPENMAAHYNLTQIYGDLGDSQRADEHAALHAKYKPDDNATDRAVATARIAYPAANHAAEAVVIYDLGRPEAYTARVDNPEWEGLELEARVPPPPPPAQAPR